MLIKLLLLRLCKVPFRPRNARTVCGVVISQKRSLKITKRHLSFRTEWWYIDMIAWYRTDRELLQGGASIYFRRHPWKEKKHAPLARVAAPCILPPTYTYTSCSPVSGPQACVRCSYLVRLIPLDRDPRARGENNLELV